ncbi:mitochondrial enolase superfamily member 1 [Grus japonensis]|uniref:Mitochondrial enolase superfamily member 1 n=1 Tax=Grus japonensis TaxID=30415 RepID=A0ABC9WIE0_GRUJA
MEIGGCPRRLEGQCHPIYKKDLKEEPGNYRPISLTSVPRNVMEQILLGAITSQMKHVIWKSQHRFTRGKSCLTNLIAFYDKVTCSVDVGQELDIVYLDFSKPFHTVSHSLLLDKLMWYGLDKWSVRDLDDGIKCTLMKFADDTKLSGEVHTLEGRAILKEDLDRLEEWANKNLMNFNKDKCKVLHLAKHNPRVHHRLGYTQLGSNSVERDLVVLVDNKLNMSEECAAVAKQANRMLGCMNQNITIRDKEVTIPLSACHATSGIWCSVLVPAIQKRCGQAGEGPEKGHRDDQRTGKLAI